MRLKHFTLPVGEQILKAMADESRIRILNLIYRNREMCISDLEQVLDFTQTKTSRHLTYLRNAGLVSNRKIDQWVYYSLKDETEGLIQQMLSYFEKDATLLKDQETYRILHSNRELAINKLQSRRWSPD
ncbi:MAG: metalloregulator ArsR/SmtB family transcription factor [Hymenobacteraceae bacterium]|nr:metalloregulator ArsR/SmtB family transcription factor [Hymenobacteraceae bacterium]MDX5396402.1 metalloregulator ArsR/SmtB family transcription factor [Hymenobacteraceae bacterium]MDX5443717.1 metalloregulator ArsR/SmtB family transcription factor [Hymenobacteraceae bacterium]MDX5512464.1 metalloregulator ArsR/SmtB family transcription factor [Hymenobacteraceae bacterium]